MTPDSWIAFAGLLLTFVGVIVGVLWTINRQFKDVYNAIEHVKDGAKADNDTIKDKLNAEFKELRSTIVTRDDIQTHISRVEDGVKQVNQRLDYFFNISMTHQKGDNDHKGR